MALLCLVFSDVAESAGAIKGLFSPSEQSRCEQEITLYNHHPIIGVDYITRVHTTKILAP